MLHFIICAKTKQKYDAILYIKAKTESQDLILVEKLRKPAKYMHMLNLIGCWKTDQTSQILE